MSRLSATLENGMGWVCRQMAAIGLLALMIISACTVVDAVLRRFFASDILSLPRHTGIHFKAKAGH